MISERISDDIPPQMKSLNMIIPILMHYYFSLKKDSENVLVAHICPAVASCIKPLASCIYSLVSQ